ncbi:neurofilament light polypeptide-like [Eurytemora carolleeae]|uniref:neurofilament light polypeptide-like n=1 Tax=Eurytemora carolleeae TaxID=1294199 RepID=UPI000C78E855|nr:neurofilament light polypeptide-like [Eurytemora carolleeae]|eukprot:XP_023325765.1 neurofilament light polypeptide-like [Eurytemora affinis]
MIRRKFSCVKYSLVIFLVFFLYLQTHVSKDVVREGKGEGGSKYLDDLRLGRVPQEEVYGQDAEDKKVNEEEEAEERRRGKNGGKGEEEGGEEEEQTGERKPLESLSGERVHG